MEQMNLHKTMINWSYQCSRNRKVSILMDQRKEQVCDISTGIPQGSHISPIMVLIYITALYKTIKEWDKNSFGLIDGITIIVQGKLHENSRLLNTILEKCKEWITSRGTKISMGDNLLSIHFSKR